MTKIKQKLGELASFNQLKTEKSESSEIYSTSSNQNVNDYEDLYSDLFKGFGMTKQKTLNSFEHPCHIVDSEDDENMVNGREGKLFI